MTAPANEPIVRNRHTSVHVARPMFQVLRDDSQTCSCHVAAADRLCSGNAAMRTTEDDYRTGGVFL